MLQVVPTESCVAGSPTESCVTCSSYRKLCYMESLQKAGLHVAPTESCMTGRLSLAQLPGGCNGSGQNKAFLAKAYYIFCPFTSVFACSTVFADMTVLMYMWTLSRT